MTGVRSSMDESSAGLSTADGPIFVGGASRSGKTLLRWMLSSHSRIAMSRRTNLWTQFYGRFGDLADPGSLERCVNAVLKRKQVAALGIDSDRLLRDFRCGPATYARLFELLHLQHAAQVGKPRWGDQTGLIEVLADEVLASYPGAKMIQLVRDPRDRHVAISAERSDRRSSIGATTSEWMFSVLAAQRNGPRYPDRFRVVRYEDLVQKPEAVIERLCGFLGESFERPMVTLENVARYREADLESGPITDRYVGIFRGRMDSDEISFAQRIAGSQMEAFGYPVDPIVATGWSGRLEWPVELAAFAMRRLRDRGRIGPTRLTGRPSSP